LQSANWRWRRQLLRLGFFGVTDITGAINRTEDTVVSPRHAIPQRSHPSTQFSICEHNCPAPALQEGVWAALLDAAFSAQAITSVASCAAQFIRDLSHIAAKGAN
jgi:hypothetical protein